MHSSRQVPLTVILTIAFALFSLTCYAKELKLTILYMNDAHAHYLPYKNKGSEGLVGGFARAAALIDEIRSTNRAEGRETLFLFAGDLLMGTPFSTVFKGTLGVQLLNHMRLDAMVVGNHEFDYSADHLVRNLKPLMHFPLLSANIFGASGESLFKPYVQRTFPACNCRAFIFGVTTDQTPVTTHPKNVQGLQFEKPEIAAQRLLDHARPDDLVIALTHLGVDDDEKLAAACPRINVVIGGHSHTKIPQPLKVNDTIICQAGSYARDLGRLDLVADGGKIINYSGKLISLDANVKEEPAAAAIIEEHRARLDSQFSQAIAETKVRLDGDCRFREPGEDCSLGRLVTLNMLSNTGADVALVNAGAIRGSVNAGTILSADVYTALPFADQVVTMGLTGDELLNVLQRGANLEKGSGGRLQTRGVTYRLENGTIVVDRVGAKPFSKDAKYVIATNDFLAAGGDGYTILKEKGTNVYNTAMPVSELVIGYMKSVGVVEDPLSDAVKR
jgi:5'-nucleotidase / UDP-sugar diphosphatase